MSTACPFCEGRHKFSGDPARSFCDEHYRQYLATYQVEPRDLDAYRAKRLVQLGRAEP